MFGGFTMKMSAIKLLGLLISTGLHLASRNEMGASILTLKKCLVSKNEKKEW